MEVVVKHLQRDKATGILSYRRRFPKELAQYIPSGRPTDRGRTELKVSLRATSLDNAAAKDRLAEAERQYEDIVSRARKMASGTFDPLDDATITFLASQVVRDGLDLHHDVHWLPEPSERKLQRAISLQANSELDLAECKRLRAIGDIHGMIELWGHEAASLAKGNGYHVDPNTPSFGLLCRAVNDAQIAVWEGLLRRLDGEIIESPTEPARPNNAENEATTFEEVAKTLMESKVDPVGQSSIESWSTALRFFRETHGTPKPGEITRKMVTEWLELMAQRPSRLPREERNVPLRELVARYADRRDVERLSSKTLNQHLGSLSAIWNKGQTRGHFDENLTSPFTRHKLPVVRSGQDGRDFSVAELQTIFSLPVFTRGERPPHGRGEASYWLPLLLLWTGGRPEEIAQLMVSDFFNDEDSGRLMMQITGDGTHPVKGKRRLKTTESGSGSRTFPVPQALLDLNLEGYLAALKADGEIALFPKLVVKSQKKNLLFPSFGEWWSGYLKDQVVRLEGKGRRPSREFRQSWATAARQSGVPEEAMSYLMGHSNANAPTTRDYGRRASLGLWMEKVAFAKLDLSMVKAWKRENGS